MVGVEEFAAKIFLTLLNIGNVSIIKCWGEESMLLFAMGVFAFEGLAAVDFLPCALSWENVKTIFTLNPGILQAG